MTKIVLDPDGADELTIDESEIISHTPVKTHTGMGTLRAQLATTEDLLPYAKRKDRINVNIAGSTEWTGLLVKPGKKQSDGITSIKAFGIAKILEDSRPDYANEPDNEVSYSSIALQDAIDNYWSRTPFNATVTPQSTQIVAPDADIQTIDSTTEWQNAVSISDTKPLFIENGFLKLGQSGFLTEAEDANLSAGGGNISDTIYSDGQAHQFGSVGDELSYTFSVDYTIPAGDWEVQTREHVTSSTNDKTKYDVLVDGNELLSSKLPNFENDLSWESEFNNNDFDITPGSHTVTLRINESGGDLLAVDLFGLFDTRYTYNFDNTLDVDGGHLDGPELYPTEQTTTLSQTTTQFNIDSLTLSTVFNDTSNNQEIAVSNDGGANFTSTSNSETIDTTFGSAGRQAQVKLTLDGFGSRTNATPTTRFSGQKVDLSNLDGDLNDLVVIQEFTLTGNHFENLQELHEYGNFQWTIEHSDADIGNLSVVSYQEGDETRPTPAAYDNPIEKSSRVDSTNYYNAIFLRGREGANGGYPTAEVKDTDEINDIGDRIDTALTDPNVTTDEGAEFRANALLDALTDENNRRGEITIPLGASITNPGYARSIDFGDGSKLKTIEEVRLREGADGVEQTHVFNAPDDVGSEIEQLRRETRQQRG